MTWKNDDASGHTMTSDTVTQGTGGVTTAGDGKFESGSRKQDPSFSLPVTSPYFCRIHPATMREEITVR